MTRRVKMGWATVALCCVVVGCGNQTSPNGNDELARTHRLVAEHADVQRRAQEVTDSIRGNVVDRAAAEFLVDHVLNNPTRVCMREQGYSWEPPELEAQSPAIIEPFGMSVWLREPLRPVASQQLQLSAPFWQAEQAGRDYVFEPGETEAISYCLKAVSDSIPSDDDLGFASPPHMEEMWAAFGSVTTEVDAALGLPEGYAACMRQAGTVVEGAAIDGFYSIRERLQTVAAPDPQEIPVEGAAPSPEWTAFLRTEQEVLEDDAVCRVDVYAQGIERVFPALERFASDHERELEELDSYWENLRKNATSKGFVASEVQLNLVTVR